MEYIRKTSFSKLYLITFTWTQEVFFSNYSYGSSSTWDEFGSLSKVTRRCWKIWIKKISWFFNVCMLLITPMTFSIHMKWKGKGDIYGSDFWCSKHVGHNASNNDITQKFDYVYFGGIRWVGFIFKSLQLNVMFNLHVNFLFHIYD